MNPVPNRIDEPSSEWIREHYGRIHRAAWRMTGDAWEAEDLAQETFVVALDKWHRFEGRSSEATWLFGILLRLRQRRRRTLVRMRQRLQRYVQDHFQADSGDDPQTEVIQQQWRESVWADVAELPPPQRDAVTLKFGEGLTYEEIATILGCPSGTVKTRVYHGIRRLKRRNQADSCDEEESPLPKPIQFASRS